MAGRPPKRHPRDAAIQMQVGSPEDNSAISEILTLNGQLFVIKAHSIFRIVTADETDPDRTNPSLPNTQQLILKYGTHDEIVVRTLLTAIRLFRRPYLARTIDCDRAVGQTFYVLKDLISMHEIFSEFCAAEERAITAHQAKNSEDNSQLVPAMTDVEARFKAFVQKSDHAMGALYEIAKVFYPNIKKKNWGKSLAQEAQSRHRQNEEFLNFLQKIVGPLEFARNVRNCIEHKTQSQQCIVRDFSFESSNEIIRPTIEVVHPTTPQPKILVRSFMEQLIRGMVNVVEVMIAQLSNANVDKVAGFDVQVILMEQSSTEIPQVQYSYVTEIDGRPVLAL